MISVNQRSSASYQNLNEARAIARLQAIQDRIQPFDLVLGGVRSFLPGTPVIYLHVEPTPGLLAARRVLLQALGPDKHPHFVSYLTLAMRLARDETSALLAQLQHTEWHTRRWTLPIDHLWLVQRGPNDPAWRYIHRLDLSSQPQRRQDNP